MTKEQSCHILATIFHLLAHPMPACYVSQSWSERNQFTVRSALHRSTHDNGSVSIAFARCARLSRFPRTGLAYHSILCALRQCIHILPKPLLGHCINQDLEPVQPTHCAWLRPERCCRRH
ncbi:hypothetical protein BKA67DRAFT_543745 [Truncatella angustata]|uniref:Secreted protein n=1 Tax=Truncatella angustata TaxID=152316 RepID=A0A9P9A3R0_9PEZI|nr:uncharacterized protein BKA67DRAFT_543745 [Truncatella angustata]KAH6659164.1 hypothetical protein BKA67DRAFT_543745 [Truncatella angustata]